MELKIWLCFPIAVIARLSNMGMLRCMCHTFLCQWERPIGIFWRIRKVASILKSLADARMVRICGTQLEAQACLSVTPTEMEFWKLQ